MDSDTHETIEERAEETDQSKFAIAREWITEHERLSEQVDELETENDRLRRELAATNQRVDEHQELVEYVERELEADQRREQRRQANVFKRAWWWVAGAPGDDGDDGEG